MARVGKRTGCNFGFGRQLSYAGPQALKDLFGDGHFATVKAHSDRWQAFVQWCRSNEGPGLNDARQIDREILMRYAAHMREQVDQGNVGIATAQNRLSSVNRTMAALRGDQCVKIPSPSKALGLQRSSVRSEAPQGQDRVQVRLIAQALTERQQSRVNAIVLIARETGMRLREAILADLPRLQREAQRLGKINIQDGTKGGRSGASAPRWITVTDQVRGALARACEASPSGSRNLLAPDESYKDFIQKVVRPARDLLHEQGLKGFHELRAAYACERYEQLTGFPAPVNGGRDHRENRELDQRARRQISHELGHNRIDVVSAYIGGRR
ncbi:MULTISPECIES: integrase domain-containing protein [unclassified Pseudomonas]|uniref:integrase domain-containing protein n=1 Tax=unclassified Pseudomonas TaxID=196821 RepID=UPI0008767034|nr:MULTISPECIES: integrase domain-containing protein [unclassified Pseudomonas]SCZ33284.1 Integrase [Pseudomonas sp. NFACC44-2]SDA79854.1 Integrase [Pseudomonas sp. NFACC51]SFH66593.1 Integrase [Pseudomonas sp. NFACC54]SFT17208.1 Integrase [Pseudomonas sp. NFACC48-1]